MSASLAIAVPLSTFFLPKHTDLNEIFLVFSCLKRIGLFFSFFFFVLSFSTPFLINWFFYFVFFVFLVADFLADVLFLYFTKYFSFIHFFSFNRLIVSLFPNRYLINITIFLSSFPFYHISFSFHFSINFISLHSFIPQLFLFFLFFVAITVLSFLFIFTIHFFFKIIFIIDFLSFLSSFSTTLLSSLRSFLS